MIARVWRRIAEARAARDTDPIPPQVFAFLRGGKAEANAVRRRRERRRKALVRQLVKKTRRTKP